MSLRRLVAILLISLANVFILAHAVVPHYHHDGIVCIYSDSNTGKCTPCGNEAGDDKDCCHEEETHHSHTDGCDLAQLIERSGNAVDDNLSSNDFNAYSYQLLTCICTLDCYNLLVPDQITVGKYIRYVKHRNTYTTPFVGAALGLRAPPHTFI